ncbi:MAG: ABC transporter permease [SAR324 cluster bacterium]|nr:ABC transporter permease [SAR324 cluster bacterium]
MLKFLKSSPIGSVSFLIWVILVLVAVFADYISPYDPLEADYGAIRKPPSSDHILGTDHMGRDVLSRIIYGTRITLIVAITSVVIGDFIGFIIGLITPYFGKNTDTLTQRLIDVLMSFPDIILALMLLTVFGSGLTTVVIVISVTRIPYSARITRSVVLTVKEHTFVEAAKSIGVSNIKIIYRHIAPQCIAPMLVVFSLHLGVAIFAESALSFLGLGIPPPDPSWGNMLGSVLASSFKPPWWLVLFPGLAITIAILSANLLGDGLRDFLDPKLKNKI